MFMTEKEKRFTKEKNQNDQHIGSFFKSRAHHYSLTVTRHARAMAKRLQRFRLGLDWPMLSLWLENIQYVNYKNATPCIIPYNIFFKNK
jgi:hypothetical protein